MQNQAQPLSSTPSLSPPPTVNPRPPVVSRTSRGLGAIPTSQQAFNSFNSPPLSRPSLSSQTPRSSVGSSPLASQAPSRPSTSNAPAPNYNISFNHTPVMSAQPPVMQTTPLAPAMPAMSSMSSMSSMPSMSTIPLMSATTAQPLAPASMGSILAPSKPTQPTWSANGNSKTLSKDDWGDFDPLS
jgi:SCY1-like protein 2